MVSVDNARKWVGAVVLLVILAAIGVLILSELYGTIKSGSTTINNQTTSSLTAGTAYDLATGDTDFPADLGSITVTNETSGHIYSENASNWHFNSTYGTITILSTIIAEDEPFPNFVNGTEDATIANFNITFSYEAGETKTDAIKNGTSAIRNVTKQLPTVGIIIGVLLIVGAVVLIAKYFGKGYTA